MSPKKIHTNFLDVLIIIDNHGLKRIIVYFGLDDGFRFVTDKEGRIVHRSGLNNENNEIEIKNTKNQE